MFGRNKEFYKPENLRNASTNDLQNANLNLSIRRGYLNTRPWVDAGLVLALAAAIPATMGVSGIFAVLPMIDIITTDRVKNKVVIPRHNAVKAELTRRVTR